MKRAEKPRDRHSDPDARWSFDAGATDVVTDLARIDIRWPTVNCSSAVLFHPDLTGRVE